MNFRSLRSLAAISAITLAGVTANALTLTSVTPENNSVVEQIGSADILLAFDQTPDLVSWEDADKVVSITCSDGMVYQGKLNTYQDWSAGWPPNVYIAVQLSSDIEDNGTYTLTIPAGKICEDGNYDNVNEELTFTWYIGQAPVVKNTFAPLRVEPESGSTLETIGTNDIKVYFKGEYMLTDEAFESNLLNCVRLKDENGNVVATSDILWDAYNTATGETLIEVKFIEDITDDGTYTITFPEGIFAPSGETEPYNEEFTLTYTVFNPANNTGTLNLKKVVPAVGEVEAIPASIELYFDKTPDFNWDLTDDDATEFSITDEKGNVVQTATFRSVGGGWGSPVYIPLNFQAAIEAAGTYTLTIPAGRFTVEGDTEIQNKELKLTWTIKGVEVGGDDTNCDYTFEYVKAYFGSQSAQGIYSYKQEGGAFDGALITWGENAKYNPNVKPYVEDENGNRTMCTSMFDFSGETRINFNAEETKLWLSGEYTLVLPKGFAGTAAWKESGYTEGVCNDEIIIPFTYEQDPGLGIEIPDYQMEVTKFGFYNGSTAIVDFTQNPATCPNITGGSTKKFLFGSNKNEIANDIYVEVKDETDNEIMWNVWTYKQATTSVDNVITINGKNSDGDFEVEFSNSRFTLEFLQGHEYAVTVKLYHQFEGVPEADLICYDSAVARFTGTTKAYEYSPVTIDALSIPEGGDIANHAKSAITITFSAPVNITGSDNYTRFVGEGQSAYENIVSNADRTQWTLQPKESSINACNGVADYRFQAKDDQGRTLRSEVYYTSGQKDGTYITLSYSCFLGGAQISVDPEDGTEVEELYAFTFTAPSASHKNIGYQGVNPNGKLIYGELCDSKGNVVAKIDGNDYVSTESGEYNIDCQMHLDHKIVAPGTYTLNIPGALFMTGTESAAKANKPMSFTYTILGDEVENFDALDFSIGDSEKHSHLGVVHAMVPGTVTANPGASFILKKGDVQLASTPVLAFHHNGNTMLYGHFNNERTVTNEVYTVVLPEGSVTDESNGAVNNALESNYRGMGSEAEYVNVALSIGDYVSTVHKAVKGESHEVNVSEGDDWKLTELTLNGADVTSGVSNGLYVIPADKMDNDVELEAKFDYNKPVSFDFTTGVENIEGCVYSVKKEGGKLVITGLTVGDIVRVYTVSGMQLANAVADYSKLNLSIGEGVYVVTINDTVLKVRL